jgi:hypothetical protein
LPCPRQSGDMESSGRHHRLALRFVVKVDDGPPDKTSWIGCGMIMPPRRW